MMLLSVALSLFLGTFLNVHVRASPFPQFDVRALQHRTTQPTFPASPASCQICSANYASIQNCAEAAPVLANFSQIIFNPGAFINVIQCSCTETFQSVFPQCVDCFEQTNQTDVLAAPDLPSVLSGMRQICALESTLLGSAVLSDGVLPSSTSAGAAAATSATTSNSQPRVVALSSRVVYLTSAAVVVLACVGQFWL
ncbi:hypothetical protein GYMLUDRAFT_157963 [Collybiopsis luxurians FD-317 M1]|nr:hypothetical protein GYMLUDRAFT_157963 [Collybiopsis luxurians FD-317 M1]